MRGINNKKYRKYYLAIFFAVVLVLLPTHPAKANWLIDWSLEAIFGNVLFLVFSIAGKMIGALATLLNWAIHIPVYPAGGIAVIDKSWEIMRNFANMFFIVALILMAFATIFDVFPGAAKYNARALFGRFLLTALLINFSLVLGVMVIQGTQVLSNTFLTAIGDMANRLGQDLNPSQLLPSQSTITAAVSVDATVFGTLSTLLFSIVLIFTYLFSILTALIFTFIRIPILWALLVVSPIAWILNIFPGGEGKFKQWWSVFIGWNMFLPIFLFFMYFGLYFLDQQGAVMTAIADQSAKQPLGENIPFTFQMVFMYIMTAIFMIGGTIVAMKASMFSGTGVVSVAGWARGKAANWTGLRGANQAFQERRKEIEAGEGRLGRIFGGPPMGLESSRKLLGVRGGDYKTQKEFVDRAGKEYDLIQNQYDTGKLNVNDIVARAEQGSATNPETYAYRKMAAKMGKLTDPIFAKTVNDLSNNPYALQDFIKTAKESKFSDVGADKILDFAARQGSFATTGPNALPGRREAYKHIQSNAKIMSNSKFGQTEFNQGVNIFGGHTTADGLSFLEDVGKTRPDLVIDYNMGNADVMKKINDRRAEENKPPINRSQMFDGYLKDAKDIANIPLSVWNAEQRDANGNIMEKNDFQQALERKLKFGSPKAQRNFRNRIIDNLRTSLNGKDKEDILKTLAGASDTDQTPGDENLGENDLDLDNEEGNQTPSGRGGVAPRTAPTATGRGSGQFRQPPGFAPSTPSNPRVSPSNVVDLRGQGGTATPKPQQNPTEYIRANLDFFDRNSQLKTAEESLDRGAITRQELDKNMKMQRSNIRTVRTKFPNLI